MSEKTGATSIKPIEGMTIAGNLAQIVDQLDAKAPKVDQVDYNIMDMVIGQVDFTKVENSFEAVKLFYEQLWAHVVWPLQDERHLVQRENGRLLLEWDDERRRANAAEKALESLREDIQEKGIEETK